LVVRNFSRYHKYTLGSELRAQGREIVGVVIAANSRVEKLPLLLELREKLERLQVLHSETALACQITVSREVRCGSGTVCRFPAMNDCSAAIADVRPRRINWRFRPPADVAHCAPLQSLAGARAPRTVIRVGGITFASVVQ